MHTNLIPVLSVELHFKWACFIFPIKIVQILYGIIVHIRFFLYVCKMSLIRRGSFFTGGHISIGGNDRRSGIACTGKSIFLAEHSRVSKSTWTNWAFVFLSVKVSNYDNNTGLPLVHLWNMVGDEVQCLDTPGLQITFIVQQSLLHVAHTCSLRVALQIWPRRTIAHDDSTHCFNFIIFVRK